MLNREAPSTGAEQGEQAFAQVEVVAAPTVLARMSATLEGRQDQARFREDPTGTSGAELL